MKFRSTTGDDVHLSLTSGHTAVVTPDGSELPAIFHKAAIANECLPEGVADSPTAQAPRYERKKLIVEALNAMLAGSDAEDFTKQGKPSISKLNARVGFTVDRSEADAIWDEMSATAE